jgi:phospholipid/cholesterol/gamma-HCH transport system ATP-binding protein
MDALITVKDLDVGYDGEVVLQGLDFAVQPKEITVVLGRSGCGKSTILKTLIGLMPPLAGEVYFSGERVDYLSEHSLENLYRRIGVLYQNSALLNSFTLYENIALPLRMHYPHLAREIEREMVCSRLSQVGLVESRGKYPAELSGGMRKRAALARAMVTDPEIIFCDEPSAGLDPITAAGLDRLMLNLKDLFGITFLVVTHELRSIDAIADKALVLNDGGLHYFGEYSAMMARNDPFINSFFLKDEGKTHDQ